MTTIARNTPPPAANPASIAVLDGDSPGANIQIKEYEYIFIKQIFNYLSLFAYFLKYLLQH